jgi:hypothetical protein
MDCRLELRPPSRTVLFHWITGLVALLFVLASDTRCLCVWTETILPFSVAGLVILNAFHRLWSRVRLSPDRIATRVLGVWRSRALPAGVRFEPRRTVAPLESLVQRLLGAPPPIAVLAPEGKRIAKIGFRLLADLPPEEYERLLRSLNGEWWRERGAPLSGDRALSAAAFWSLGESLG